MARLVFEALRRIAAASAVSVGASALWYRPADYSIDGVVPPPGPGAKRTLPRSRINIFEVRALFNHVEVSRSLIIICRCVPKGSRGAPTSPLPMRRCNRLRSYE
jgi:hypothetical protein